MVITLCLVLLVILLVFRCNQLNAEVWELRKELFMIKACRAISTPMNYGELAKKLIKVNPLEG